MAQTIPELWCSPSTTITLRAWEVDPHNLDYVRREIDGLQPSKTRLTYGYRSDTRTSAEITIASELMEGSWVRLTLDVGTLPREELGTFVVSHKTIDHYTGLTTLTLHSAIWAISEDRFWNIWTVGQGTTVSKAIKTACEQCGRAYVLLSGFRDAAYGQTIAYSPSEASFAKFLFDAAKTAHARLDVDGHGRLTFDSYIAPAQRAANWIVDERDEHSVVLLANRKSEDATGEAFNRSVVTHTKRDGNNQQTIIGAYDTAANHASSSAKRGYTRAKVHEVSDMAPETVERAYQLAKQYSTQDSDLGLERQATVMWCPIAAGDVIEWIYKDGAREKRLVRTAELNCAQWTKALTMEVV
ncbi:hypothetical protein [Atopobium fossor]|uniref:hypothetical protein n=1 Tax=Atopobium fossor TaxID=39487 RepID=UPI00041C3E07|nr:hypothetical protein [Atopobium fossor]